jgi:hypothetical protein
MAYTDPKTWSESEALTHTDFNTYIRDNQTALKSPPSDSYVCNEAADYTTTSTSFVDVDATNLSLQITTTGGDVMAHFYLSASNTNIGNFTFFDIDLDGTRIAGDDGMICARAGSVNGRNAISATHLVTSLAAGTHTFKLQWKCSANTSTVYAGAGTANGDLHPQFWVREVS